ncbi:hypothetical protein TcG_10720 [Trypanosoma cruzi]|nr:hypothetical protein TcG_10720 [Trypanosoma cruzi]
MSPLCIMPITRACSWPSREFQYMKSYERREMQPFCRTVTSRRLAQFPPPVSPIFFRRTSIHVGVGGAPRNGFHLKLSKHACDALSTLFTTTRTVGLQTKMTALCDGPPLNEDAARRTVFPAEVSAVVSTQMGCVYAVKTLVGKRQ